MNVIVVVAILMALGGPGAVRLRTKGHIQGKSFDVQIANFFTVRNGLIESDDGGYDTGGRPCTP